MISAIAHQIGRKLHILPVPHVAGHGFFIIVVIPYLIRFIHKDIQAVDLYFLLSGRHPIVIFFVVGLGGAVLCLRCMGAGGNVNDLILIAHSVQIPDMDHPPPFTNHIITGDVIEAIIVRRQHIADTVALTQLYGLISILVPVIIGLRHFLAGSILVQCLTHQTGYQCDLTHIFIQASDFVIVGGIVHLIFLIDIQVQTMLLDFLLTLGHFIDRVIDLVTIFVIGLNGAFFFIVLIIFRRLVAATGGEA